MAVTTMNTYEAVKALVAAGFSDDQVQTVVILGAVVAIVQTTIH